MANKQDSTKRSSSHDFTVSNTLYSKDRISFFIDLLTETDNPFQQGQTSNTPISYEVICDLKRDSQGNDDGVVIIGRKHRVPLGSPHPRSYVITDQELVGT